MRPQMWSLITQSETTRYSTAARLGSLNFLAVSTYLPVRNACVAVLEEALDAVTCQVRRIAAPLDRFVLAGDWNLEFPSGATDEVMFGNAVNASACLDALCVRFVSWLMELGARVVSIFYERCVSRRQVRPAGRWDRPHCLRPPARGLVLLRSCADIGRQGHV